MKKYLTVICIVLIGFSCLSSQIHAEESWWDKSVDVLKNLGKERSGEIIEQPSSAEIGQAFKQALRIGTENVTGQLGTADGFNADPLIHIPLPEKLNTVKTMLSVNIKRCHLCRMLKQI